MKELKIAVLPSIKRREGPQGLSLILSCGTNRRSYLSLSGVAQMDCRAHQFLPLRCLLPGNSPGPLTLSGDRA
jgi:hypothetical protein